MCASGWEEKAAHQYYMVACHVKAQTILGDRLAGLSRAIFSIVDCPNDLLEFDIEQNSSLNDLHIRTSARLIHGWMPGAAVSRFGQHSRMSLSLHIVHVGILNAMINRYHR